jgi:hypothetical protein
VLGWGREAPLRQGGAQEGKPTEAGLMPPEVVGWRVWVIGEDRVLRSPIVGSCRWDTAVMVAECQRADHTPPGRDCSCGFWATRWTPRVWEDVQRAPHMDQAHVLGLVQLWGEVAVHGYEGWRASHARILALWGEPSKPTFRWGEICSRIRQAARRLGVPVIDPQRRGWQALVRELGAPSLDWLRPEPHCIRFRSYSRGQALRCWAVCSCGWQSTGAPWEATTERAQREAELHRQEVSS